MTTSRLFFSIFLLGSLLCLFSCEQSRKDLDAQRLNDIAYQQHYRSLDSVKVYSDSVLNNPDYSDEEKAEALNNLVFYNIGKMNYSVADSLARLVYDLTDNHIELLVASVQEMRLCQRHSDNKNFYEHRQRALQHLQRINEEDRTLFTPHQLKRLVYAESEMHIVESAYDYYVGLDDESRAAIDTIDVDLLVHNDTVQYIQYLYNVGSGGIIIDGTSDEIQQQEFEALMEGYMISIQYEYPFWQANILQAISDHLLSDTDQRLVENNQTAISYLNIEHVEDSLLAGNLAQRAQEIFKNYGDLYQTAASWRTLSNCYFQIGDYPGAIYCLQQALSDKKVEQSPSLMSSIHEDMSIAFAALNDKPQSDKYRNAYLDMQEKTRQDRQLEARADQLQSSLQVLDIMVIIIICVLLLLFFILLWLVTKRFLSKRNGKGKVGSTIQNYKKAHDRRLSEYDDQQEELEEQIAVATLSLDRQQEAYEEHRAKMSLIDSLTPLIDRMIHEIKMLDSSDDQLKKQRAEYIVELTEQINRSNSFLTEWIRLKQGDLSLRIETFSLEELMDILRQSAATFRMAGITLEVGNNPDVDQMTDALEVKADRTLTLFMLNTLCDNARKFTPRGGTVTVDAKEVAEEMVEISVSNTGEGMSQEVMDNIFVAKPIKDEKLSLDSRLSTLDSQQKSHGFGLLNCKGIIEKYKKTSPLFAHCMIGVESELGKSTRFFFRLPKGIRHFLLLLLCMLSVTLDISAEKKDFSLSSDPAFKKVYALADSIYQSNVNGCFERTVGFGFQFIEELNRIHTSDYKAKIAGDKDVSQRDTTMIIDRDTLQLVDPFSTTPAEVCWLRDSLSMPFDAILTLRNEMAVAALALHDWQAYNYNNKVYIQLFREMSVDPNLDSFCRQMQQTETNRNVAIMLLVILLLAFVPVYYFLYYRHVISDNKNAIDSMQKDEDKRLEELETLRSQCDRLNFEVDRLYVSNNVMSNSLSTIKHETMYFPSRINQMFSEQGLQTDESAAATAHSSEGLEVSTYYRSLYDVLTEHAHYNSRHQLDAAVLVDMLIRKLAKLSGQRKADILPVSSEGEYLTYEIQVTRPDEISQRLCTQIVRDLGELFNLRRCGIISNNDNMQITIPNGKF